MDERVFGTTVHKEALMLEDDRGKLEGLHGPGTGGFSRRRA
jgi:hypothetical protein